MAIGEILLTPGPQAFTANLNGTAYNFRLFFADAPEAGWALDISDSAGVPIVCGIPLIPGVDLLEQYAYLGIGVRLWVVTEGDSSAAPTFGSLGTSTRLFCEPT